MQVFRRSRSKDRRPTTEEGNKVPWDSEGKYRRMLRFNIGEQVTPCSKPPPWGRQHSQFQMHRDPDRRKSDDIVFESREVLPGSSHHDKVIAAAVTPRRSHFSTSASSSSHSGRTVDAVLEAVPKQTFRVSVSVSTHDPEEDIFCHGPNCGKELQGDKGKDYWRQKFKKTGVIHWYCRHCWLSDNRVWD